ncbi:MAG TPA: hypothetical protein VKA48_06645 [Gammaproteobacteria bacterium]|nr:hypothetical protein [Gammaproteobacteria bacterium]
MSETTPTGDRWLTRRLRLQQWRPECASITEALGQAQGVGRVEVDEARARVTVDYDVLETGLGEVERRFAGTDCPLAAGWTARLRRALYRYLDENARANARHRPAPCCSNPSELYTRKHK